jgi:hypothetical protein
MLPLSVFHGHYEYTRLGTYAGETTYLVVYRTKLCSWEVRKGGPRQ